MSGLCSVRDREGLSEARSSISYVHFAVLAMSGSARIKGTVAEQARRLQINR